MVTIVTLVAVLFLHVNIPILAARYEWSIRYAKTNPDGYFRTVIGIEDSQGWHFPGPLVRAAKGEVISVLVHNQLPTEATSIHWHGQRQYGSPWMDGVQQISQYPILPTQTFNYTFHAESIGTHWYHSHTGGQYTDGLFGPLIVDDPDDPYKDLPERIVLVNEWYHRSVIDTFDIFTQYNTNGAQYHAKVPFVSGLFNGKGRYNCSLLDVFDNSTCTNAPYEQIIVNYNTTYRFRFIGASSQFTTIVSIDQHNLTIVVVDGIYVRPYTVQRLVIEIGQRYDVLVSMNQAPANYWIRAVTGQTLDEYRAILQYSLASSTAEPNSTTDSASGTILLDSTPLVPLITNAITRYPPIFNRTIVLNVSCNEPLKDKCFINNKQLRLPNTPTLLTMYRKQVADYASTNIIDIFYGEAVLFIINNFINITHPFHLHGHDFYVIGAGTASNTDIINFNLERDRYILNYENPPIRDTIGLPQQSWLMIGFVADNPGSWLLHCHIAFDMEAGMGVVINVNNGTLAAPPDNYPVVWNGLQQTEETTTLKSTSDDIKNRSTATFMAFIIIIAFITRYM